ncbi:MAG: insulinase family protein, partial [Clostridiales bacterium]|nr:insulinase family protein [Clostridiales bacterium]
PCLEDGQLRAGDVQREKRLLVEHIQSEENEKRIYALRRLEAEMFRGEAYGVNRLGTVEQVEALTPQDVTDAWRDMLEHSQVTVTLVGSADAGCIAAQVKEAFACVERAPIDRIETQFVPCAGDVRRVEEQLDVNQGKLVLGFRVDMKPEDAGTPAMRSTVDMFGGGPYSLLFQNVREKMSLCYYCSAMYVRAKSALLVQCGCENENMETAIQEIGNQLQVLRDGSFQDKDFQASKIGMTDTLRSVSDSPDALEAWYAGQLLDEELKTPEAAADQNEAVSREEIAACANRITLDTIYMLKSTGKGEGDAQ